MIIKVPFKVLTPKLQAWVFPWDDSPWLKESFRLVENNCAGL